MLTNPAAVMNSRSKPTSLDTSGERHRGNGLVRDHYSVTPLMGATSPTESAVWQGDTEICWSFEGPLFCHPTHAVYISHRECCLTGRYWEMLEFWGTTILPPILMGATSPIESAVWQGYTERCWSFEGSLFYHPTHAVYIPHRECCLTGIYWEMLEFWGTTILPTHSCGFISHRECGPVGKCWNVEEPLLWVPLMVVHDLMLRLPYNREIPREFGMLLDHYCAIPYNKYYNFQKILLIFIPHQHVKMNTL